MNKFLFYFSLVIAFGSCTEEAINDASLSLDLEFRWENQPFQLEQEFNQSLTAEQLKFQTLRFYLSNVALQRTDGSWWEAANQYFLVDAAAPMDIPEIKGVPSGSYKGIRFMIGVDSLRNVSGAQEGALSVSNGMFWNWNTGYIFMKAEGIESTSGNFSYHLGGFSGTNAANPIVSFSFGEAYLDMAPNQAATSHFMIDVAALWNQGLTVGQTPTIHMPGTMAKTTMNAFASGWIWDHNHQ